MRRAMNKRPFALGQRLWILACLLMGGLLMGGLLSPLSLPAQQTVPPGYRGYDLRHAEASDVAPKLRGLLDGVAGEGELLIDRQNNRILLKGSDAAHRLAGEFLKTLDTAPTEESVPAERAVVRGYPVGGQRLQEVTAQLQERFREQAEVRIVADQRTGQVIVAAAPRWQQQVASILENGPTPGPSPAAVASPATAAILGAEASSNSAASRNSEGSRGPVALQAPGLSGRPTAPTAPTGANAGGNSGWGSARTPVAEVEGAHSLRHLAWRDFEDELRRIWGPRMSVQTERNGEIARVSIPMSGDRPAVLRIDRRHDLVHFEMPPAEARGWAQIVRSLDAPRGTPSEETRLVPQQKADPAQVYQAVSLLQSLGRGQATGESAGAVAGSRARPASAWGGQLVSMIFQQADGQPATPPAPSPAAQAPAGQGPGSTGQAPAGEAGEGDQETATIGPVRIEYIEGLDVFVVRGNRRDVARVVELIEQIQRQSKETQPVIEVRQLQFANSVAVTTLISELYETVFAPRQSPVSITALDKPNAVLLIGQRESVGAILDLIAKLDTPVAPDTQFQVFRLRHLSAIDAETTVRNFFVDRPGAGDTIRPGLGMRVRVIADYRTNALLVQASPRDLAEIAALLEKLDVEDAEATMELRVFRLKNTLASDMVPVLQEAITGVPTDQQQGVQGGQAGVGATRPQSTRRSTNISILGVDAKGNRMIQSGILSDMVVTADPNVNALLVRGPASGMDLIAELIRQLDQLPEAEAQIKVFALENGDATTLTALLQELFGQPVTAGQGTLGQAFNVQRQNIQSLTGGGESSLVPLRFTVDVRTNSIVATGSRSDLNVVETLLLRLDEGGIETRRTEVYFLQNAPAQDVALAIQQFLENQRLITQQLFAFQAVTPFEQIDREVIVVPELVSNSLIVSATPRYYDAVRQIIRDLDFKPPLVLVQVVLAAVQLDDAFEFGVEFGLQDSLLFDRGRSNIGFNFLNPAAGLGNDNTAASNATRELLAGQALSGFNMGRINSQLGYGGLVLSAANESVNILVRALQDQGRLQVLARPQVMTLDNEEAFVQIGQRVPRITGSSITPQGGTQSTVVDEPVGLLLRIRPRVNREDVVVMTVDTERSEVDFTQGVPVSVDQFGNQVISPLIETITAQTTLSARSGQTVVFAGLIAKSRRVETRRVPYLSDVPLLGHLFRYDSESTGREELMIFLTPHIVRSDEDIERLKQVESSRMSWCLADLVEMHGPAGLSGGHGLWNPPPTPTIYPHLDPTGAEILPTPAAPLAPGSMPAEGLPQPRLTPPAAVPPSPAALPPAPEGSLQPPTNGSGGGASSLRIRPAQPLDISRAGPVYPNMPAVAEMPVPVGPQPPFNQAQPAGYLVPSANPQRSLPPERLPLAPERLPLAPGR